MSPDGKAIQVNSNALQALAAQNASGILGSNHAYTRRISLIVNFSKNCQYWLIFHSQGETPSK